MATMGLRIGIVGCGPSARIHVARLRAIEGVAVVGCTDASFPAAEGLASEASAAGRAVPAFADHSELIRDAAPDALAIFTPHPAHYRPAMDGLQAGCHVFVEKPLSTVVQEAVDIVGLARARGLKVGVGHHLRLLPSLIGAKRLLAEGAIGPVRLVTATLAQSWLESHRGEEHSWRFDPRLAGGGILADSGVQLIDGLLWTSGLSAVEVAAITGRNDPGPELVAVAVIRLSDGTPATLAISGVSPGSLFEWTYHGERGRLRVTESSATVESEGGGGIPAPLDGPREGIDANFVAAATGGAALCCPADEALDTVRLLEAIARSAAIGQMVRLA